MTVMQGLGRRVIGPWWDSLFMSIRDNYQDSFPISVSLRLGFSSRVACKFNSGYSLCPQLTQERIALFKTMEGVLGSTFYSLPPTEKTLKILMFCGKDLEVGKAVHLMAQSRKNIISP